MLKQELGFPRNGLLLILNSKKTWAYVSNNGVSVACVMPLSQSVLCSAKEDACISTRSHVGLLS